MDLVIMAAGMASRFGSSKQLTPIDENGNFIMDYSIFDAINVGFDHIIFIIRKEQLEDFENTIEKRINKNIKVDYAFQDINNLPIKVDNSFNRIKPWGTGHAILCAKQYITSDFMIINADDFYGPSTFKIAYEFLNNSKQSNEYALIAYKLINTLSENGSVKRGLIKQNGENLSSLTEIEISNVNELFAKEVLTQKEISINKEDLVSMNCYAVKKEFLSYLEDYFINFLYEHINNLSTCELFLPNIISDLIKRNKINVKVVNTNEKWFGLTYKDDLIIAKSQIIKLIDNNIYPENIWKIK